MVAAVVVFVIIGLVVVLGYSRRKKINAVTDDKKKEITSSADTEGVVNQLEQIGYFKYSDPEHVANLKDDLNDSIANHGMLRTIFDQKTLLPLDYKYYFFDGERIFGKEGFKKAFKDMRPFFDKIALQIELTDYTEKEGNHWFMLNAKKYIVFQNFEGQGWNEAAQRFAEILNDQLLLQGKDERLYLINRSNDGSAVFLTDEQFKLLDAALTDKRWKPLKIDEWCYVFKVDPEKYLGAPS